MLLSEIQLAVHNRTKLDGTLVPIIPDRKGDGYFDNNDQPFCKLSIVPFDNKERVYKDGVMESGFILVNIYAPDGHGSHDLTKEAEKFIALFDEYTEFDGITIPDKSIPKGALDSEHKGWFYVSALIYFEVN